MSIIKIGYEDKKNYQVIGAVQEKNKSSAEDMNEIKNVVNNNAKELQDSQDTIGILENEIKKITDLLPRGQVEGEYISIQDGTDFGFKEFKVEGNSKQDETISPTTPSTIQNVTGNINITVTNKNMANADNIYARMQAHYASGCSEVTVDGKECIRFINTRYRPDIDPPFDLLGIKYKGNTSYTIRGMFKKDGTTETGYLTISAFYTDGTYSYVRTNGIDWQELRLVTSASKTISKIGFSYGSSAWWLLDKSSIFVAEGDTANYIANEQQEAIFPLIEGQKLMKGDYLAEDGIHRIRKQIYLDGTENWKIGSINQARYSLGLSVEDLDKQVSYLDRQMLSNWFVLGASTEGEPTKVNDFTFRNFSGGNTIYFFFPKSYFTATTSAEILAEWKTKLAEAKQAGTPMVLEYKLAEETTEAYTEEQQMQYMPINELRTYKNGTNVYSTNEVSPIFKVEYIKDLNAVLTQVNQLILEGGI